MNCPDKLSSAGTTQRGATLIVALVVVLLVVMLATRISSDYLVLFRTVENQTAVGQARAYLRGAESVAKEALLKDLMLATDVDNNLELWAQPLQIPLPEGILQACLLDLQSRLNLNDLGATAAEGYSSAQRSFIRLLQVVNPDSPLDQVAAVALAHAVFDWLDVDNEPRQPGGAEALDYLQYTPPYRPANQAFVSTTELILIKGMTTELVTALTPYISVWGNGYMNFNTLDASSARSARLFALGNDETANSTEPPAPVLLRTLNNADSLLPINTEAASLLVNMRINNGGTMSNLEFFNQGVLAAQNWDLEGLGLNSEYFLLTADMQIQTRHYQLQSVLHRSVNGAGIGLLTVLSRHFGTAITALEDSCAAALP